MCFCSSRVQPRAEMLAVLSRIYGLFYREGLTAESDAQTGSRSTSTGLHKRCYMTEKCDLTDQGHDGDKLPGC